MTKARNATADLIRIIAILGVLSIHVTGKTLIAAWYNILGIPLTFYVEVLSRYAVPLFFMVSGYVLASRYTHSVPLREFYRRRIVRILIPYIVWTIVYTGYNILRTKEPIHAGDIVYSLLTGGAAVHLYFIPAIFLLYALFPWLKSRIPFIRAPVFIGVTILECALLLYDYFIGDITTITPIRVAVLNTYPFLIGMLTHAHETRIVSTVSTHRIPIAIGIAATGIALIYQTEALFLMDKNVEYINRQWHPLIMLYASLIWIYLLTVLGPFARTHQDPLSHISRLSFFVFFVHILYENVFWRYIGSYLFSRTDGHIVETLWFTPAVYAFVLGLSYGTAEIMGRIPKLRTVFGIS